MRSLPASVAPERGSPVDRESVVPDILCLGKAMTSGLSLMKARRSAAHRSWTPGRSRPAKRCTRRRTLAIHSAARPRSRADRRAGALRASRPRRAPRQGSRQPPRVVPRVAQRRGRSRLRSALGRRAASRAEIAAARSQALRWRAASHRAAIGNRRRERHDRAAARHRRRSDGSRARYTRVSYCPDERVKVPATEIS